MSSNDMGLIKEIETNLQIAKADLSILRDRLVRAYILRSKVQYYNIFVIWKKEIILIR